MIRVLVVGWLLFMQPDPVAEMAESGRVIGSAESPSERLLPTQGLAPGAPPAFSFRTFDAAGRGRLSDVGLMTDDAGH